MHVCVYISIACAFVGVCVCGRGDYVYDQMYIGYKTIFLVYVHIQIYGMQCEYAAECESELRARVLFQSEPVRRVHLGAGAS